MMKDIAGEDSGVYVKQINLKAIIIGSPGAGKSTFARRLRDATNLIWTCCGISRIKRTFQEKNLTYD